MLEPNSQNVVANPERHSVTALCNEPVDLSAGGTLDYPVHMCIGGGMKN